MFIIQGGQGCVADTHLFLYEPVRSKHSR